MPYATPAEILEFATEFDALPPSGQEALAESASRLFDNLVEVKAGYFNLATGVPEARTFYGKGTPYLGLDPYVAGSLGTVVSDSYTVPTYHELYDEGFLLHTVGCCNNKDWLCGTPVEVTADWGFAAIPSDIKQAVIALSIHLWRTADPSWASISQTGEAVKVNQIPQQAAVIAKKYREKFTERFVFA